jgi:hypothetical protein
MPSKEAELCFITVSCWILFVLVFEPEDAGDMFLRNVDRLSTDYTALYPRR